MRDPQPVIVGHQIVLLGRFNPQIFHPSWFSAEGLIQKQEGEVKVEIIHPDAAIFNLEWLRIEVTAERFVAGTTQEPYEPAIRDLILGTFSLLAHTPIMKMGINRDMHFRMESEEKWHTAGDILAPKNVWEGVIERPGLRSLTIEGNHSRDGIKGATGVKIEPSVRVPNGVFFSINDHFVAEDEKATTGSKEIMNILNKVWAVSHKRSEDLIYSILSKIS